LGPIAARLVRILERIDQRLFDLHPWLNKASGVPGR
jgi:hypothetical protein